MASSSSSTSTGLEMEKGSMRREPDTESLNWKPGKSEWLILISLTIVTLMVAIDATILVPALPIIASSLHGTATDTFWAGTSYLLASAVVQPFLINLSDIFGRRYLLIASLLFFTIGTLVCCTAQNFTTLLSGRSIQGIGGGGCIALIHVIITDIVPLRYRPKYQSLTSLAWAVATITGPLIGGLLSEHTTWRWIFYINFPLLAIGGLMTVLVVKFEIPRPHMTFAQKFRSVDWIGGTLFIGSLCSFLIGVTWAGSEFAWSSAQVLAPILVGIVFLSVSIYWELCQAKQPFLRLKLFSSPTAVAAYFCAFLQGLLMFCFLYYLPFFFETCKSQSPTLAGVDLIPTTAALMPASIVVSLTVTRLGRYRWAIWSGWLTIVIASGCLILLNKDLPSSGWIPIFVFCGMGHGIILMSLVACIQASSPTKDVAYAAAMYTFVRTLGMVIGVAVGGTVFQNVMTKHLGELGLPTEVANNAEAFVTQLKSMSDADPTKGLFQLAYSRSFVNLWEVLVGIAALGALSGAFIKGYNMDKELDSEHLVVRRSQVSEEIKV